MSQGAEGVELTDDEVQDLALGQLTSVELEVATDAFNGFGALFGRDWLDSLFGGAKVPGFVRLVAALWLDWVAIRNIAGADELKKRWRGGINAGGVQTEIQFVARAVRAGYRVELFPATSGRVCDQLVSFKGGPVYVEVSARGESEVLGAAQAAIARLAEVAAEVVPGEHGRIVLLAKPDSIDIGEVEVWIRNVSQERRAELPGKAIWDVAENTATADEDGLSDLVDGPVLFATHLRNRAGEAQLSPKFQHCLRPK